MPDITGYIPVYFPDRTVVGKAKVASDGKHLEVDLDREMALPGLIDSGLIGLSIVFQSSEAFNVIEEAKNKEQKNE